MIYLDNAATGGLKPQSVLESYCRAAQLYAANPGRSGHSRSVKCAEAVYRSRSTIASFFGLDSPERCVFTSGCTASVNMALKGLLNKGDHLIISDLEHNAVCRPANTLAVYGVEVTRARVYPGDDEATVASFAAAIKRNTKMIFCTHASNVTGARLPVERLGELAWSHGILFGIDAAQSGGVLPVSFDRIKADIICLPSHKGLCGIMGSGLLLLNRDLPIRPLIEGGTGSYSMLAHQPQQYPERCESGTLNVPGIVALAAGVEFVNSRGVDRIFEHELALCESMEAQLERISRVKIRSCRSRQGRVPITTFTIDGINSESAAQSLSDMGFAVRGGLHCAPDAHRAMGTVEGGAIRVSPSVYNTESDAEHFCRAVSRLCF